MSEHLNTEQLEAGMEHILQAPLTDGALLKIVRRPDVERREIVPEGELDKAVGLVGDNWEARGSSSTVDGSAHPEAQLTIINARLISLIARSEERWQLSGDQLVVDLDISVDNLPAGTRLSVGSAVLEVTNKPHTGCGKFSQRFGKDALRLTATPPREIVETPRHVHSGCQSGDDPRGRSRKETLRAGWLAPSRSATQRTVLHRGFGRGTRRTPDSYACPGSGAKQGQACCSLVDSDDGAGLFQPLLGVIGLVLGNRFFDCRRGRLYELFGFLESERG